MEGGQVQEQTPHQSQGRRSQKQIGEMWDAHREAHLFSLAQSPPWGFPPRLDPDSNPGSKATLLWVEPRNPRHSQSTNAG